MIKNIPLATQIIHEIISLSLKKKISHSWFRWLFVGCAWCTLCRTIVTYGTSGKKIFQSHSSSKSHIKCRNTQQKQPKLPASFGLGSNSEECRFPYGAPPNVSHDDVVCAKSSEPPPIVNLVDRKSHAEARTLAFTAEHGLPLKLVPELIR